VLFIYNQEFRFYGKETPRRNIQLAQLNTALDTFGVDPRRIVYVEEQKGEGRCYDAESPNPVRLFFWPQEVSLIWTVLSDNGNSFKEDGKDIFLQLGFGIHEPYQPAAHQYLYSNDNKLHGAAKQKWRQMRLEFTDDVTSSIALLRCMDDCSESVLTWFDRNLQICAPTPKLNEFRNIIQGVPIGKNQFARQCLQLYKDFSDGEPSFNTVEQPPEVESDTESS